MHNIRIFKCGLAPVLRTFVCRNFKCVSFPVFFRRKTQFFEYVYNFRRIAEDGEFVHFMFFRLWVFIKVFCEF